jgi:hypothetical protein
MNSTITFNNLSAVQIAAIGYVLTMPDELLIGILKDPAAYAPKPAAVPTDAPAVETPAPAPAATKKRTAAKPAAAPADAEPEAAAPAEPEVEAPATDVTVYALEAVRAALAGLSKAGKAPQAKAIIAAAGADKLTDVDPSKYAQIMAAVAQEVA